MIGHSCLTPLHLITKESPHCALVALVCYLLNIQGGPKKRTPLVNFDDNFGKHGPILYYGFLQG